MAHLVDVAQLNVQGYFLGRVLCLLPAQAGLTLKHSDIKQRQLSVYMMGAIEEVNQEKEAEPVEQRTHRGSTVQGHCHCVSQHHG